MHILKLAFVGVAAVCVGDVVAYSPGVRPAMRDLSRGVQTTDIKTLAPGITRRELFGVAVGWSAAVGAAVGAPAPAFASGRATLDQVSDRFDDSSKTNRSLQGGCAATSAV